MGQGQEEAARKFMQLSISKGHWLLLQNCHLSLHFCEEIMQTIIDTEEIHTNFRIWLTTEINPGFPIGLLQMSIKFTNEPPQVRGKHTSFPVHFIKKINDGAKKPFPCMFYKNLIFYVFNTCPKWCPLLYILQHYFLCLPFFQGIRASLKRTYADVTQDTLDYSNHAAWPMLLFSVAFLHTVVQVRKSAAVISPITEERRFDLGVD